MDRWVNRERQRELVKRMVITKGERKTSTTFLLPSWHSQPAASSRHTATPQNGLLVHIFFSSLFSLLRLRFRGLKKLEKSRKRETKTWESKFFFSSRVYSFVYLLVNFFSFVWLFSWILFIYWDVPLLFSPPYRSISPGSIYFCLGSSLKKLDD